MATNTLTPPKEIENSSLEALESAAGGWFDCEVQRAGPAEDGSVYIWLRHTGGTFNCWFSAAPLVKREMLATALAAMSGRKVVNAYVTSTDEYSVVNRMYMYA